MKTHDDYSSLLQVSVFLIAAIYCCLSISKFKCFGVQVTAREPRYMDASMTVLIYLAGVRLESDWSQMGVRLESDSRFSLMVCSHPFWISWSHYVDLYFLSLSLSLSRRASYKILSTGFYMYILKCHVRSWNGGDFFRVNTTLSSLRW